MEVGRMYDYIPRFREALLGEDLDGGSTARVEKSCYPRVRRVHS